MRPRQGDVHRLLVAFGAFPFIETVRRNQAAALFESLPEAGLGSHRFHAGIDHFGADGKVLAGWGVVYVANFVGAVLLAFLFYFSGLWQTGGGALGEAAVQIAHAKVNLSFSDAFIRAVGCNWLVCLAVWMALASRQIIGKVFAIFFPIMGFVAIGFEHSIANMYFIPSGLLLNQLAGLSPPGLDLSTLTWGAFLWKNLLPVTIGNIIGGVVFVGLGYWGAYLRPVLQAGK